MTAIRTTAALLAAGALALTATACSRSVAAPAPRPAPAAKDASAAPDLVAQGRHLVALMGCNDCHTPMRMGPKGPEPDTSKLLAGHPAGMAMKPPGKGLDGGWLWAGAATNTAYFGPWGVSYARNLTPDEGTGLGAWTEEMFIKVARTGRHFGGGRPILPPMPVASLAEASDAELKAIYAYLRSVPPIQNLSPESVPAPHP